MQLYYLWNDQLPTSANRDQAPDDYFQSLLNKDDRFSWIQENYQELLNSLKGINKEAGFEYVFYREAAGSENVVAQILYVKPNSPAASVGLKRGDLISHINNTRITTSNYRDLIDALKENHSIRYKTPDPATETFSEEKTASLTTVQYTENPSYLNKVIEAGDRKIGYFVYNLFATGPTDESNEYDNQVDAIFGQFKSQGITDLVLDLRFNSGGAESSANNLASLIGTGVNNSKIFAKREYNADVKKEIVKELGEGFLTSKFNNELNNIGSQLTNNRIYVLTGSRTASASELVINALKPYMDVFIIGDTTYGKNVGSISIYEENDAKNTWGMQPIIVKIYNSQNQSDYTNGFAPNVLDKDNSLFIYPLGDPKEALLSHAIGQITGTATTGRISRKDGKEAIGHSLDAKRRSFNLIIDQNLVPLHQ
jgi:carboxyl-terminal processing protease